MGWITSILSETVITSFTAASAINIGASQLKHFWGVKTEKDSFFLILLDLFKPEKVHFKNHLSKGKLFIISVQC